MLGKIEGRRRKGQPRMRWLEEKGMTEDEMLGWHHCLDGHESEQALGIDDGQRSLACAVHGVTKSWIQLSN